MKKENWEKEFDKRFEEPSGIIIGHKGVKDIKSFISQLLSLQKQEILEEIEKSKKEEGQTEECKDVLAMNYLIGKNKGWNECLENIKSIRNNKICQHQKDTLDGEEK